MMFGNRPAPNGTTAPLRLAGTFSTDTAKYWKDATVKKTIATAAVTLAATAAALFAGALPVSAATTTIGVGVQGVSGPGFPGTWMTASIARGSSQSWTLKVTNTGNVTETIQMVPSGAVGLYGGGPANQPASNLHNTLSATSVNLAPGASATITDTVTVPASAALGLVPGNAPGAAASLAVNTVWAYVGPAGSSGVQMAAGAGFRQYITVTQ